MVRLELIATALLFSSSVSAMTVMKPAHGAVQSYDHEAAARNFAIQKSAHDAKRAQIHAALAKDPKPWLKAPKR